MGSGGISIRGDFVESFVAKQVKIPLDGIEGVSGYVRVRFLWQPQLLIRKKTHTSVLGDTRTYTNMNLTSTSLRVPTMTKSSSFLSPASAAARPSPTNVAPSQQQSSMASQQVPITRSSPLAPSNNSSNSISRTPTMSTSHNGHTRNASQASSIISAKERHSVDTMSMNDEMLQHGDGTATGLDGTVTICLVEARALRGVDKSGTSDPYVRLRLGKKQVFKTKHIKKTLAPQW